MRDAEKWEKTFNPEMCEIMHFGRTSSDMEQKAYREAGFISWGVECKSREVMMQNIKYWSDYSWSTTPFCSTSKLRWRGCRGDVTGCYLEWNISAIKRGRVGTI